MRPSLWRATKPSELRQLRVLMTRSTTRPPRAADPGLSGTPINELRFLDSVEPFAIYPSELLSRGRSAPTQGEGQSRGHSGLPQPVIEIPMQSSVS